MTAWSEEMLECVYDNVLVSSAMELRRALEMLGGTAASGGGPHVRQIQRGLHLMEREMSRRGLDAPAQRRPERRRSM